jgi:hypothetical protein
MAISRNDLGPSKSQFPVSVDIIARQNAGANAKPEAKNDGKMRLVCFSEKRNIIQRCNDDCVILPYSFRNIYIHISNIQSVFKKSRGIVLRALHPTRVINESETNPADNVPILISLRFAEQNFNYRK